MLPWSGGEQKRAGKKGDIPKTAQKQGESKEKEERREEEKEEEKNGVRIKKSGVSKKEMTREKNEERREKNEERCRKEQKGKKKEKRKRGKKRDPQRAERGGGKNVALVAVIPPPLYLYVTTDGSSSDCATPYTIAEGASSTPSRSTTCPIFA